MLLIDTSVWISVFRDRSGQVRQQLETLIANREILLRELHKKDDPIVKWFDKGFPQTTLANGEVD